MASLLVESLLLLFLLYPVHAGVRDVPLGHMKPLGAHTEPGTIEERSDLPTAEEFWEKYVKALKPVVFRGINKISPAYTKWTAEYLKEQFGDMELRIEQKREISKKIVKGDKGLARDTLRNFINTYHLENNTKYVISELPEPMYKDFLVPPFVACGSLAQRLVEVDLWIGGGGSSSLLHKDAFHIINCLLNGTKEWKMIETKYEKDIYKKKEELGRLSGFSKVDPIQVDLLRFPQISKVPWSFVLASPGDCLYVPKSMYHQVRSYGTHNLAVSLLFSRFDDTDHLNFSDCPAPGFKPLSEMDPDWQYSGSGTFSMGNDDLEYGIRDWFTPLLDSNGRVKVRSMAARIKATENYRRTGISDQEVDNRVNKVFAVAGKTVEEGLTRSDILTLTKAQLREIFDLTVVSDPYNTYEFEYYELSPFDIVKGIKRLVRTDNQLNRTQFVQFYTSVLGGTVPYGEELFNKLGGEGKDSISKEVLAEKIDQALYPYDENELKPHPTYTYGKNKTRTRKESHYKAILLSGDIKSTLEESLRQEEPFSRRSRAGDREESEEDEDTNEEEEEEEEEKEPQDEIMDEEEEGHQEEDQEDEEEDENRENPDETEESDEIETNTQSNVKDEL